MNLPPMSDTEQKIFASAGCAYLLSNAAELATGQRERELLNERSKIFVEKLIDLGVSSLSDPLVEMGIRLTMETVNRVDSLGYFRGLTLCLDLSQDFSRERPALHHQTIATKMSPVQIFDLVKPSVWTLITLNVSAGKADWKGASQGTAVAIGTHRLLTNCHTLTGNSKYLIVQPHLDHVIPVKTSKTDFDSDRCILEASEVLPTYVDIRESAGIAVGEDAYSVGSPSGLELTMADGIVSGKRMIGAVLYLQTTTPISKGSSGGGLFDNMGRLIGITTFYVDGGQNLNFAIAADQF